QGAVAPVGGRDGHDTAFRTLQIQFNRNHRVLQGHQDQAVVRGDVLDDLLQPQQAPRLLRAVRGLVGDQLVQVEEDGAAVAVRGGQLLPPAREGAGGGDLRVAGPGRRGGAGQLAVLRGRGGPRPVRGGGRQRHLAEAAGRVVERQAREGRLPAG